MGSIGVGLGALFLLSAMPAVAAAVDAPNAFLNIHMASDGSLFMDTLPPDYLWAATGDCTDPAADVRFVVVLGEPEGGGADPVAFNQSSQPRFHAERSVAEPFRIGSGRLVAYIRLPPEGPPLPDFYLVADLLDGEPIGAASNLNASAGYAHGQSASRQVLPTGQAQYLEVEVPLQPTDAPVPRGAPLTLVVTLHTGLGCQATHALALASVTGQRSRLELGITPRLSVVFLHPEPAAGVLLVHAAIASPWGGRDVDAANASLLIAGPSAPRYLPFVASQGSHVHSLHDRPAELTWMWRFRAEGALPGDYNITVTASDVGRSATVLGHAGFHVDATSSYGLDDAGRVVPATGVDPGTKESPGPTGVLLLAVVVACAALRGRP